MFKKSVLVLACLALLPSPAMAQFFKTLEMTDNRDKQVMADLAAEISDTPEQVKAGNSEITRRLSSVRGGFDTKKALGQYMCKPEAEYKSEYTKVPVELQCRFAYDLHEMLTKGGYDWPSVQKNYDLKFMPYDKQLEFAMFWWQRNYPPYKELGFVFKDWFLSDALIDATLVYGWYGRKQWASADYIVFEDASIQHIESKK